MHITNDLAGGLPPAHSVQIAYRAAAREMGIAL
jgi:hypothetical protein